MLFIQRNQWFRRKPTHLAEGKGGQSPGLGSVQSGTPQPGQALISTPSQCCMSLVCEGPALEGPYIPTCRRGNRNAQSWIQFLARTRTQAPCPCKWLSPITRTSNTFTATFTGSSPRLDLSFFPCCGCSLPNQLHGRLPPGCIHYITKALNK